jgi:hypothetical protein
MAAMHALWQTNPCLAAAARWSLPRRSHAADSVVELAMLVMLGALAAIATQLAAGSVRLPGHAILRGTLPLVLGLSLAPRRTAGSVMSIAAAATFGALLLGGLRLPSPAAWVGLLCLGPAMDLAVIGARGGWRLYVRFAAAGLVANLAAFSVRMTTTPLGAAVAGHVPGSGGGRASAADAAWAAAVAPASWTSGRWPSRFALFGAIAGLVCAMIWFRARPRADSSTP